MKNSKKIWNRQVNQHADRTGKSTYSKKIRTEDTLTDMTDRDRIFFDGLLFCFFQPLKHLFVACCPVIDLRTNTMIRTLLVAFIVAANLVSMATSSISPVVPLGNMAPEHACYFLCDICFNHSVSHVTRSPSPFLRDKSVFVTERRQCLAYCKSRKLHLEMFLLSVPGCVKAGTREMTVTVNTGIVLTGF